MGVIINDLVVYALWWVTKRMLYVILNSQLRTEAISFSQKNNSSSQTYTSTSIGW